MEEVGNLDSLVAVLFMIYLIMFVVILLIAFFSGLGNYKMFKKMGIPGWKGFIPFYANYIKYERVWEVKYFWYQFITVIFYMIANQSESALLSGIGGIVSIVGDVFLIMMCIRLAKKFNRGTGFGVGLALLPCIFNMILGFGSAVYQEEEPQGLDPFVSNEQYGDDSTF